MISIGESSAKVRERHTADVCLTKDRLRDTGAPVGEHPASAVAVGVFADGRLGARGVPRWASVTRRSDQDG